MSRLTIEITEQQHQALKAMAAIEGKSIKAYALQRLFPPAAEQAAAWAQLRTLLEERLAEAARGEVTDRSIGDIAAEELRSEARR